MTRNLIGFVLLGLIAILATAFAFKDPIGATANAKPAEIWSQSGVQR